MISNPATLRFNPEGQVYLVDFGLAKVSQPDSSTAFGAQALTPGYAPPEQYGQGTDPRSDIYALGATLYGALTGRVPEDGLGRLMGTTALIPLRKLKPQIPNRLAAVIEKAMSINPDQRYQTGLEFKVALLSSIPLPTDKNNLSDISGPSVPLQSSTASELKLAALMRKTNRQRMVWIGSGLFILVLISAGVLLRLQNPIPLPPPASQTATLTSLPPAQTSTATLPLLPQSTPTLLEILSTQAPTSLPSTVPATLQPTLAATRTGGAGGDIAFASDRSGVPQVYIMDVDNGKFTQVTQFPDGACQPDWSPDGQQIVFVSPCPQFQDEYRNSSLFIIQADGTGLQTLDTIPGGDFEPAWSPDGKTILFTSLRERLLHLYLYDLADDIVTGLSAQSTIDRRGVWSPDGSQIAFQSSRLGENWIWTMNSDGSNVQGFSPSNAGIKSYPAWSPDGKVIYYSSGSNLPFLAARVTGDPTAAEVLISETIRPVWDADVSPDSRLIAFESRVNGNLDIYTLTRSGSSLTRLTVHSGEDFDPVWRPVVTGQ